MNRLLLSRSRSSSRSSSRPSSRSYSTGPRTEADQAHIVIQLENGRRFMVFVPQDATIGFLHEEALRRASKFGIEGTTENTEIQTTGRAPLSLFPQDALQDMISETEHNTFKLLNANGVGSLGSTLAIAPSKEGSETDDRDHNVKIRWITLEKALLNPRLSSIEADQGFLSRRTSLDRLHGTAVDKLLTLQPDAVPAELRLYIKDCYISAKHNPATFDDLGLYGTRNSPLDIFVDIAPSNSSLTLADVRENTDLSTLWGFATTMRGVCAFTSCLDMLSREMSANATAMQEFLQVVFESTHFPPLVLAFAQIFASDWKSGQEASSLRIIASAMHQVCAQLRPSAPTNSALEASRQAFAWLKITMPARGLLVNENLKFVGNVKIVESNELTQVLSAVLPHNHLVNIPVRSNHGQITRKSVLVALDRHDDGLARFLAHCLAESYSITGNHFLVNMRDWTSIIHHKKTKIPVNFDVLVSSANSAAVTTLNMIGPLQLGSLPATALPVLTLGSTGNVSVYNQEDYECSQKRFVLWNAVQKREVMPQANPGPYLAQKLETIISARNADQTLDVDAWDDIMATAHFGVPKEAIVVCLDRSSSMSNPMPVSWRDRNTTGSDPSRLTESKELFKNLATRIAATKSMIHLGIVAFSGTEEVSIIQELTGVLLNFEDKVEVLQPRGRTAIYDGLETASGMLTSLKLQQTDCRLRIIVLTDGEDNDSAIASSDVAQTLFEHDIVLDSIVIGTDKTGQLFRASRATGGYAFASNTQEEFFQVAMLETMVDISRRPDIIKAPFKRWTQFQPKSADMSTLFDIPPCRPHPNQNDDFIALESSVHYWKRRAKVYRSSVSDYESTSSSSRASSVSRFDSAENGNTKVILYEIQAAIDHYHHAMDIYISESTMTFWLIVMEGPAASAYDGGTFLCYLDLSSYPSRGPEARFVYPVLHPNVTKHGKICHPIFDREFSPHTRVYEILQHIWGLFMSLEARDAIDPMLTMKNWTDPIRARRQVQDHVARFAALSRKEHRAKILREDSASISTTVISSDTDDTASSRSAKRRKV